MSNSLGSDQARQNVGPDLGPNCLQKLSADHTSRQRVTVMQTLDTDKLAQSDQHFYYFLSER